MLHFARPTVHYVQVHGSTPIDIVWYLKWPRLAHTVLRIMGFLVYAHRVSLSLQRNIAW